MNIITEHRLNIKNRFALIFILTIIATQGMKNQFFYFNWFLGGLLIFSYVIKVLMLNRIDKGIVKAWFISTVWLIIPLVTSFSDHIIDKNIHFTRILVYLFYITLSVIIISYFFKSDRNKLNIIFYNLNIIWIVLNLITFVLFSQIYFDNNVFSGIVDNRNIFAIITTVFSSYLMFFKNTFLKQKKVKVLIFLSFLLVVSTLSIKGFVGWIIVFLMANFKSGWNKIRAKRNYQIKAFLLTFAILIGVLITDNPLKDRLVRFTMVFKASDELRQSESAYVRYYLAKESWSVFKQYPFAGIGVNNTRYYLIPPHYRMMGLDVGTYSHNNYLEILLSGGLISFLLYYIPFFYAIFSLRRKRKISIEANYFYALGVYKLFIDFGSVSYDGLIMNIVHISIFYGYFYLALKKFEQTNLFI